MQVYRSCSVSKALPSWKCAFLLGTSKYLNSLYKLNYLMGKKRLSVLNNRNVYLG